MNPPSSTRDVLSASERRDTVRDLTLLAALIALAVSAAARVQPPADAAQPPPAAHASDLGTLGP